MTPKEKAIELVARYYKALPQSIYSNDGAMAEARIFSRICVKEILSSFDGFMDSRKEFRHELETEAVRYWQQVLTEIDNL